MNFYHILYIIFFTTCVSFGQEKVISEIRIQGNNKTKTASILKTYYD